MPSDHEGSLEDSYFSKERLSGEPELWNVIDGVLRVPLSSVSNHQRRRTHTQSGNIRKVLF